MTIASQGDCSRSACPLTSHALVGIRCCWLAAPRAPSPDGLVAGGKEKPAIGNKRETTREGHDAARQDCFARPEQTGREGHDCSRRSRSDIVATVRTEIAAAGIEVGDRTSFGGDAPMWIEREDAIVAIVYIDSVPVRMDAKPARVGDTAIGAERAEHFAIEGEGQYRAITVCIHRILLSETLIAFGFSGAVQGPV
jgi:hypothetical protein